MTQFANYSYAQPTSLYAGAPIEEVKALNKSASEEYNLNKDNMDALSVQLANLSVEDRNNPIKMEAIQKANESFKNTLEKGDYQNARNSVRNASKDFLTNQKVQAALKSKALHDEAISTAQKRLDEGKITQKRFNFEMQMNNLKNTKPIEYDAETGEVKNMFNATKVGDDLSGVIQDDLDKKINAWKAGDLPVYDKDGKPLIYAVDKLTGTEKALRESKGVDLSEVYQSLKQGLKNNEKYMEYFKEENAIDKFNQTFDPKTKTNRPLNEGDINFITDAQKKSAFLGFTDEQIKELENSKNSADKALLDEIKLKEKDFNLEDPAVVEDIYNKVALESKLDGAVMPASNKASYTETKLSHFTDQERVLALKDYYDKKKFEREKPETPLAPLFGTQTTANLTGGDFSKEKINFETLQAKLNEALMVQKNTPKESPLAAQNAANVLDLQRQINISKGEIVSHYTKALSDPKTKQAVQNNIESMFIPNNAAQTSNQDYRISITDLTGLINEAKQNKNWGLDADLNNILTVLRRGDVPNVNLVKRVTEQLTNDPSYMPTLAKVDKEKESRNTVSQRPLFGNDTYSGFPEQGSVYKKVIGTIGGLTMHHSNVGNNIDDLVTKANNENALTKSNTVYTLNDAGFKNNTPEANRVLEAGRAILNGGDLSMKNGRPLRENLEEGKYFRLNDKGEKVPANIDPSQSMLFPVTGVAGGEQWGRVTFKDEKGNILVDEDGNESMEVKANNSNAMSQLKALFSEYAYKSKDAEKFYDLEADRQFGNLTNKMRGGLSTEVMSVPLTIGNNVVKGDFKTIMIDGETSAVVNPDGSLVLPGTKAYFKGNPAKVFYELQQMLNNK